MSVVEINPEVVPAILQTLREARALVYRDAESFGQAAAMLEHIGQLLAGEVRVGLGKYEVTILSLAGQVPGTDPGYLKELYRTVREARNDSVHSGAFIRHHVLRLVELFLLLEEAISANGRVARDLMVRNPTTAEIWHNVAMVRQAMLTNSFSFLPLKANGTWKVISDRSLVSYLQGASNKDRTRRLGLTIESLLKSDRLKLEAAPQLPCSTPVEDVKTKITQQSDLPVLIVDSAQNLLGILTAFDLL